MLIGTFQGIITSKMRDWSSLRKIFSNTGWLLADRAVRMGAGLFVGVWVARYLGPEQYGIYNYALAFVSLFAAITTLGLDSIVVRNVVLEPSARDEMLGTAFVLKLLGGLVTLALSLVVIYFLRPHDSLARWLVGITAAGMIFQAFDTIDFWFQSQVMSKFTVWTKNTALASASLVRIALILLQAHVIAFAWVGFTETLLGAIGLVFVYRSQGYSIKDWKASLDCAKSLLKDSWPLIFSSLMVLIYMRIDQVMLGEMVDNKAVGIYSAAVRLSEVWYFIPMIIASSVFPYLIKNKQLGMNIYKQYLQQYFDIMVMMAYVLCIPTYLFSDYIIHIVYGNMYHGSDSIFSIHIWSCLFVFMGVAREKYLVAEGLLIFSFICSGIGCIMNIMLNLVLIPKYNGIGAALATAISQAVSSWLMSLLIGTQQRIWLMQCKAIVSPIRLLFIIYNNYKKGYTEN